MTELRCPSCGGALELDEQHPDMETCLQCHAKYQICWERSAETGKEEVCLKPLPKKIAYEPVREVEKKKSGWEPWGWKRGVALVILFFVLMGIMYGPKIYRRYQMDHGGGTGATVEGTAEAKGAVVEGMAETKDVAAKTAKG